MVDRKMKTEKLRTRFSAFKFFCRNNLSVLHPLILGTCEHNKPVCTENAGQQARLPSYGITRSQRNYAVIRFPKSHLPLSPFRLRGHTRFVMIGVHSQIKNFWASLVALKTQCKSASGSSTPGLSMSLAKTRPRVSPSGVHTLWAASNRKPKFRS